MTGRQGIAAAAVLVTAVTAVSRLTGFAREVATAAVFGASPELDAFLVAQGLPNVVIALISTATVTAAIPVVSARIRQGDVAGGHQLFRTTALAVLVVLAVASVAMAAAAPRLVAVLAPGFAGEQLALAARLTRILLLATVLVAGMNLVSGLLQVHRRFFWPAFVGIPFNLAMLVGALGFGARFGVFALAWGFVAGSLLRVLVQLPSLRRTAFRWAGRVRLRDTGLTAVTALLPVVVLGHLTSNVNSVVDRVVGSGLDEGAISALNYAFRLLMLPHGLLVVAVLQVLYPALAAADRATFRPLATRALGVMSFVLVPVAAVLAVVGGPLVEAVYGRGAFGEEDAARTTVALVAYAPGLVFLGLRDVALRGLYGLQDRWRPALAALAGMVVNVAGDVALGPRYGVAGLATATTLSFAVSAAIAVGLLARSHGAVAVGSVAGALARCTGGGVVAAGVMVAVAAAAGRSLPALAAGTLAGAAAYVLVLRVLRAPELGAAGDVAAQILSRARRAR